MSKVTDSGRDRIGMKRVLIPFGTFLLREENTKHRKKKMMANNTDNTQDKGENRENPKELDTKTLSASGGGFLISLVLCFLPSHLLSHLLSRFLPVTVKLEGRRVRQDRFRRNQV